MQATVTASNTTATIAVDGQETTLHSATIHEGRAQVIAHVRQLARDHAEPVTLNTIDPDGTWWLRIDPDGSVRPIEAPEPAPPAEPMPAEPMPAEPARPGVFATPASASTPPRHAAPADLPVPQGQADRQGPHLHNPRPGPQGQLAGAPAPHMPPALPTVQDLLAARPEPSPGPATWGLVRRSLRLAPNQAELRHRAAVASVQRSLPGPRTIVVVNPKGGAAKTPATALLAATFGTHRGGYTLGWDNNETRGTLGWRSQGGQHTGTAVTLLRDLDRFTDPERARVGDLDNYVRGQGDAQFDVLASDEDADSTATIDAAAFDRLHHALSRFYRILVVDTGNNMRASNWQAAVRAASQLVIVSTLTDDKTSSAAWAIDGLRAQGHAHLVSRSVVLLSGSNPTTDDGVRQRATAHFGQLVRAVVEVPYDAHIAEGGRLDIARLHPRSREAWLQAAAVIANGL